MVVFGDKTPALELGGNVSRKLLVFGGEMLATEVIFKKGSVGAMHSHPHEQIGYVLEGSFELNINGEKSIIKKGDTYYTEPNLEHGVVALEDGKLLDVFTPQREDFIKAHNTCENK